MEKLFFSTKIFGGSNFMIMFAELKNGKYPIERIFSKTYIIKK